MSNEFFTVARLAESTICSPDFILALISRGKLEAVKKNGALMIPKKQSNGMFALQIVDRAVNVARDGF
ncbi:MAG: hypothetical protein HZB10_00435 [Candidatus Yonathbacteria bacterium]|nr:hypothetical protein [Candidatus Yonathbacteria bacterium]